MGNTRQSNFELLRIIAMSCIIFHHMSVHGGLYESCEGFNYYLSAFLILGGKYGVDIFVLISGYFLIESKFSFRRLAKIELIVLPYSIVAYFLAIIIGIDCFTINGALQALLPICSSKWWFMTSFFALMIVTPLLQVVAKSISKKQYIMIIVIGFIFCSVIPSVLRYRSIFDGNFAWFVFLFLCGGYIRKYPITVKKIHLLIVAIGSYLIKYVLTIFFDKISEQGYSGYYSNYIPHELSSLLILVSAIATFAFFIKINIPNNKIINIISSVMIDVYIIHDSQYRLFLWNNIFHVSKYFLSKYLLLYCIAWYLSIIVLCALVGLVFKNIIRNPISNSHWFNAWCDRIDKVILCEK